MQILFHLRTAVQQVTELVSVVAKFIAAERSMHHVEVSFHREMPERVAPQIPLEQ